MKKILFITAFTPNKFSAGQNYTFNLLNDLSENYLIDICYFQFDDQIYLPQNQHINVLRSFKLSFFKKIIHIINFPFIFPYFTTRFSWSILFLLKKVTKRKQYDAIYFDFSQVFIYALFFPHYKKILMAHDIITQKTKRERKSFQSLILAFCYCSEKLLLKRKKSLLLSFSQKDQRIIKKVFKTTSSIVDLYTDEAIIKIRNNAFDPSNKYVFFAAWNREENSQGLVWFIEEVLPLITAEKEFVIIGRGLDEKIQNLIKSKNNMSYLGFQENPYPIIMNSLCLIAPLYKGAGVKVKVIESLSLGTPVIGTTVAFEGISRIFKDYTFTCNTKVEFADKINTIKIPLKMKISLRQLFHQNFPLHRAKPLLNLYLENRSL